MADIEKSIKDKENEIEILNKQLQNNINIEEKSILIEKKNILVNQKFELTKLLVRKEPFVSQKIPISRLKRRF